MAQKKTKNKPVKYGYIVVRHNFIQKLFDSEKALEEWALEWGHLMRFADVYKVPFNDAEQFNYPTPSGMVCVETVKVKAQAKRDGKDADAE